MKAKRKGARSEYKVRDNYLARRWYVTKAGGSFGIFDLICMHPRFGTDLVQVKSNRNAGTKEMADLRAFECHPSWRKKLVIVRDRKGMEWYEI